MMPKVQQKQLMRRHQVAPHGAGSQGKHDRPTRLPLPLSLTHKRTRLSTEA